MSQLKRFDSVLKLLFIFLTVPAQCAYYCYYYYSSYYSSRRQLCYYYYYYYYYYDSDSSSSSDGAIAGGVIGGLVGLAVIVTIVVCACVKICKTQNHGQIMVYPQQPTANTNSITQPGHPQPSVPVYSYGPPTYLGKNQQAVGRNNISIIDYS